MKSTAYPPPHTVARATHPHLKLKASVLATLLALPLSAFSFTVPSIEVPAFPALHSPNFDDNTSFKQNSLPTGSGWGYPESLSGEGLQNQINSSDLNYLLQRTEAPRGSPESMVHITSDATVDGLDRDLRFYQTKNDGVLWIETKRNAPSTDFILNTNGSLQFYAEDADYLIKQSKETSLTLSAGDIWLEQKITKTPTDNHNGFLFFGNNNTTSSIKTDQDFVAVLDATNVANFEGDFNLIEGNSLNITSQNIIIVQKSSDSAENSNGTGLSLDVDGDHQSHLTAQENIYRELP